MWSYFENFIIRNIMVQSKFNLSVWFNSYNFLNFIFACMWVYQHFSSACMQKFYPILQATYTTISITNGSAQYNLPQESICFRRWFAEPSSEVMDNHARQAVASWHDTGSHSLGGRQAWLPYRLLRFHPLHTALTTGVHCSGNDW